MQFDKVTYNDLKEIGNLQPDGWPDIIGEFKLYLDYDFCQPVKIYTENRIIGIGASIMFEKTAWLAHIIVDKDYRNKGIGLQIVVKLLDDLKNKSIESVLLIATELGEPVYKKAGFRFITDYLYLKREKPWIELPIVENIVRYTDGFYNELIRLDRNISGENRETLIKKHLDNSKIFVDRKELKGFYLPDLGEGLIIAVSSEVGIELMKIKYSKHDKAVIPSENIAGVDFLKQNGFVEAETKGKRMILGKNIDWRPKNTFSRIGGNYG